MMHPYKHLFINDQKIELRSYSNFISYVYIGYNDVDTSAIMGITESGLSTSFIWVKIDGVDEI